MGAKQADFCDGWADHCGELSKWFARVAENQTKPGRAPPLVSRAIAHAFQACSIRGIAVSIRRLSSVVFADGSFVLDSQRGAPHARHRDRRRPRVGHQCATAPTDIPITLTLKTYSPAVCDSANPYSRSLTCFLEQGMPARGGFWKNRASLRFALPSNGRGEPDLSRPDWMSLYRSCHRVAEPGDDGEQRHFLCEAFAEELDGGGSRALFCLRHLDATLDDLRRTVSRQFAAQAVYLPHQSGSASRGCKRGSGRFHKGDAIFERRVGTKT